MSPKLKLCLGVDLGHHTVKIVELALEKDGARVVRAASAPTNVAPSMTDDERRQAIVAAARDLIKKSRFGAKKAVFSVSGLKVFVRRFRLPKSTDERLARMIQFEARQQIPFPPDKTALQFQTREIPGETDVEVLLSAVRTDEIREFMQLANKTGLTPVAVGVSSFALYNAHRFGGLTTQEAQQAFELLKPRGVKEKKVKKKKGKKGEEEAPKAAAPTAAMADQKTIAFDDGQVPDDEPAPDFVPAEDIKGLINIGAASYDIAIGRMGKTSASILFIRTVAMGGDNMTKAIQKALNVESFFDAERIKTSSTQLMAFNFDFENEGEVNQEASMAVTEVADRMVTEIRRSLDFFITQPDGMAVDILSLSGGQALIPKIDSYLEEKLTVPVEIARGFPEGGALRWQEAAGPPTQYMVALGLALQGLGLADVEMDFLPEERKIVRDFPYKVTAVMLVLLLVIVGISSQAGRSYMQIYQNEGQSLRGAMLKTSSENQFFDETQKLHIETADKYVALSKTFGQRDFWIAFLGRLADIKPPQVLLEDVVMDHDGAVKITGLSEVVVAAAYFQDGLKEAFDKELKTPPKIDSVVPVGKAIEGLGSDPSRFVISLKFKTKFNHLDITPTPTPTPVGAPPGASGFGRFGGEF